MKVGLDSIVVIDRELTIERSNHHLAITTLMSNFLLIEIRGYTLGSVVYLSI